MTTKITLTSGTEIIVLETIPEIQELEALNRPFELSIEGDGKITVKPDAIVAMQQVAIINS